jgi:hypothetical protein
MYMLAGWFVHRLREAACACSNVTLRRGTAKRLLNGERRHLTAAVFIAHDAVFCRIRGLFRTLSAMHGSLICTVS